MRHRLRLFAVACLVGSGAVTLPTARAAPISAPSAAATTAALATYQRATWRFEGRIAGAPTTGAILLALDPSRDGTLAGETLVLASNRSVVDVGSIRGHMSRGECHLDLTLSGRPYAIDGMCSADLVSGRVIRRDDPIGLLGGLLAPSDDAGLGGDERVGDGLAGEAWLAPPWNRAAS